MNKGSSLHFAAVALLATVASACAAESDPSEASDLEVDETQASDDADDEAVGASESALPRCVTMVGHYMDRRFGRQVVEIRNACGATVRLRVLFKDAKSKRIWFTSPCSNVSGHKTVKFYDYVNRTITSSTFEGC